MTPLLPVLEVASSALPTLFLLWFPVIIGLCWSLPRAIKESCDIYLYVHIMLPGTKYIHLKYKPNELNLIQKQSYLRFHLGIFLPIKLKSVETVSWSAVVTIKYNEINLRESSTWTLHMQHSLASNGNYALPTSTSASEETRFCLQNLGAQDVLSFEFSVRWSTNLALAFIS